MSGKLYVLGTPIGNLGDFSPRGVETLQKVDFLAVEDTRVSVKILNHFGLKKPMVSYFAHNLREREDQIIARLLAGETCAVLTDAGMPCISDPGEGLVRRCHEAGVPLEAVPGPSAGITALAISGQETARFSFEGFLSMNRASRREHLQEIAHYPHTMVFYEAPHKLQRTLVDLLDVLGDRSISLVRELTKIYEEVCLTTLSQAVKRYAEKPPRGEFVLVVAGAPREKPPEVSLDQAALRVHLLVGEGLGLSEASRQVAKDSGFSKSELYKAALLLAEES